MESVVNVFLCKDSRDIKAIMDEYEYEQRRLNANIKINRHRASVMVNDDWTTKFITEPEQVAGMYVNEITISTRMSTGGDLDKLKHMLQMAREGRLAFKNAQWRDAQEQP